MSTQELLDLYTHHLTTADRAPYKPESIRKRNDGISEGLRAALDTVGATRDQIAKAASDCTMCWHSQEPVKAYLALRKEAEAVGWPAHYHADLHCIDRMTLCQHKPSHFVWIRPCA